MRELDIQNEMLEPPYSSFCIDYVRAFMLLTDPDERQKFIDTSTAQFLAGSVAKIGPLRQSLDKAMGGQIWQFLAAAPAPTDWTVNDIRPGAEGFLAGMVYGRAIHDYHDDGKFYLAGIKAMVLERTKERGLPIGRTKLEEILKLHKPCAHLWAAYAYHVEREDRSFPCTPQTLTKFLGRALFFQEWGLKIRPVNQGPLFDADKLWRIPTGRLRLAIGTPAALFDGLKIVRLPR